MSKTRVAPIKPRTLPQLELTAIEMGTRLASYLLEITGRDDGQTNNPNAGLDPVGYTKESKVRRPLFKRVVIWTDSEICLHWINKNENRTPYVKNRVEKILSTQNNYVYNHISTKENPADLLTRGVTFSKLIKEPIWFKGPQWITTEQNWPEQKSYDGVAVNIAEAQTNNNINLPETLAIDITKYSSYNKLINITRYVFQFITQQTGRIMSDPIKFWIKHQQAEYFPEVHKILERGSVSKNRLIKDLGLYMDEAQIIRCRGRIRNADLPYESKHPVLLPKKGHLTKLIIKEAHKITLHGGLGDTLAQIRKNYWIPKGRQAVKASLKECNICRRYEARPVHYPGPPNLPQERVTLTRPFEVTGVDYTGAMTITGEADVPKKVYICLFTCASTRAVHLEVAEDLSSETFLQLFRTFAARRSCPRIIISDNATNFVGAAPFITDIMNDPKVQQALTSRQCQWRFVTPRAPWQNGFTERMIGIVKNCLRKTLHRAKINLKELRTVITEIETRVNNRPLTYLDDTSVNLETITPSHLLHGRRLEPFPSINVDEYCTDPTIDDRAQYLRDSYHQRNKLLQRWERHWAEDYLMSLREKFYGAQQPENANSLQVNDIVLVKTDQNRSDLPLARVLKLYPDNNGIIRMAEILVKGQKTLRTINHLIPLECSHKQHQGPDARPVSAGPPIENEVNVANPGLPRPRRVAAQRSRDQWLNLISGGHVT